MQIILARFSLKGNSLNYMYRNCMNLMGPAKIAGKTELPGCFQLPNFDLKKAFDPSQIYPS